MTGGPKWVNGHWAAIVRISHVAGWMLASFLGGAQVVGWHHTHMDQQRHEDLQRAIQVTPGHREALERMTDVRRRLDVLESRVHP